MANATHKEALKGLKSRFPTLIKAIKNREQKSLPACLSALANALITWKRLDDNEIWDEAIGLTAILFEVYISHLAQSLLSTREVNGLTPTDSHVRRSYVLSRLMIHAPYIKGAVCRWLKDSPASLFDFIQPTETGAMQGVSRRSKIINRNRLVVKAVHAFLQDSSTMRSLLNYSVTWSTILNLLRSPDTPTRLHALQSTSIILRSHFPLSSNPDSPPSLSDKPPKPPPSKRSRKSKQSLPETKSLVNTSSVSTYMAGHTRDWMQEAVRWAEPLPPRRLPLATLDPELPSSSIATTIEGVVIERFIRPTGSQEDMDSVQVTARDLDFVDTPALRDALTSIALSVQLRRPVLLEGPAGSGKSTLLREFARRVGRDEAPGGGLLFLHLDDQIDSRSLLGTYTCTDIPGQFRWRAGALTQAVQEGRWVVMEDIDRIPLEVLSALAPLLSTRNLELAGRGETIHAAHDFQLFFTLTTHARAGGEFEESEEGHRGSVLPPQVGEILQSLLTRVAIPALDRLQMQTILSKRFPSASPLIGALLRSFEIFQTRKLSEEADAGHGERIPISQGDIDQGKPLLPSLPSGTQPPTTRHLFKWATRTAYLLSKTTLNWKISHPTEFKETNDLPSLPSAFPHPLREQILLEAIDVLLASIPTNPNPILSLGRMSGAEVVEAYAKRIGKEWGVAAGRVEYLLKRREIRIGASSAVVVGRAMISRDRSASERKLSKETKNTFSATRHAARLMEALCACVSHLEPILLVGETGNGKTAIIQRLANLAGRPLIVQNLNNQTDAADLLGGYRPVELRAAATPVINAFGGLFPRTLSRAKNGDFLRMLKQNFDGKNWKVMVSMLRQAIKAARQKLLQRPLQDDDGFRGNESRDSTVDRKANKKNKRSKVVGEVAPSRANGTGKLVREWEEFEGLVDRFDRQVQHAGSGFAFWFAEGAVVKAVREGWWLLLDEINLAAPETLDRLTGLLDGCQASLSLVERGDADMIAPHPDFRVFAAMNPATDFGKRDLPPAIRSRFTEIYVPDVTEKSDLEIVVRDRLGNLTSSPPVHQVVGIYLKALDMLRGGSLVDGSGNRPSFSLRTLCRALSFTAFTAAKFGFHRALREGLELAFVTPLSDKCRKPLMGIISSVFPKSADKKAKKKERERASVVEVDGGYLIRKGSGKCFVDSKYLVTPTVRRRLREVSRAVMAGRYNVLLQGPTSAGKTSLVEYLAKATGNSYVRINNHENTDLQDYIGAYVSDAQGRLAFHEGALVNAVRKGQWVILDELNLAPSEVLEALNRLLDDNRELLIPETGEVIKPHPGFLVFATQNPPGVYGGRKALSRAFRSRFVEIHVQDIPENELMKILEHRCRVAPSYAKVMIDVMRDLQQRRQGKGQNVFAGKHSITPRDLFRWGNRGATSYQELADTGFMLLGERHRTPEARELVKSVLETHMRKKHRAVTVSAANLYSKTTVSEIKSLWATEVKKGSKVCSKVSKANSQAPLITWTPAVRRMLVLIDQCIRHSEPVLLVGPTGSGKTTVCQYLASLMHQHLRIINCHQHTEAGDFLGGLRPVRGKHRTSATLMSRLRDFNSIIFPPRGKESNLSRFVESLGDKEKANTLMFRTTMIGVDKGGETVSEEKGQLQKRMASAVLVFGKASKELIGALGRRKSEGKRRLLEKMVRDVKGARRGVAVAWREHRSLFLWQDGALVSAMRQGELLLIDEISLADDAVLERLNSVLEPSRTLLLAEKGGKVVESITAQENFRVLATMNPGGDFGKKELSPALRNRFTEIWVPALTDRGDLVKIVSERLAASKEGKDLAPLMLDFVDYFNTSSYAKSMDGGASLRDVLSWADFINATVGSSSTGTATCLSARDGFLHGASLVFLDGLGIGTNVSTQAADIFRAECEEKLQNLLKASEPLLSECKTGNVDADSKDHKEFGDGHFFIHHGTSQSSASTRAAATRSWFRLDAPTTQNNLRRVLRAMQLSKGVLLEGSPGVGKTTLITALAQVSGHELVRINLSEQTDMMDLLGTDLPKPNGKPGEFQWCDGVFLSALKNGDWVLLDELNLASQSVLEGLNSVLDHRATVYIPELDQSFRCPSSFRVFACQNPTSQGGGRRALPKSFLSRFTKVHLKALTFDDLLFVASRVYPSIDEKILSRMIDFNRLVQQECDNGKIGIAGGGPWEFNLRDVFRWCELVTKTPWVALKSFVPSITESLTTVETMTIDPAEFVEMLYAQRMRNLSDRERIWELWRQIGGGPRPTHGRGKLTKLKIRQGVAQIGCSFMRVSEGLIKTGSHSVIPLKSLMAPLEHAMLCVSMAWPVLVIGPAGSGKTSMLSLLAETCNKKLHVFSMTSATDSTELLGCFEQVDLTRRRRRVVNEIRELMVRRVKQLLQARWSSGSNSFLPDIDSGGSDSIDKCQALVGIWSNFERSCPMINEEDKKANNDNAQPSTFSPTSVQLLYSILDRSAEVDRVTAANLKDEIQDLLDLERDSKQTIGSFEWIDGVLLKALQEGDWVVLDNANLCQPTVLDRLNPLLEPKGELLVNECGLVNGKPRLVKPHPSFRIFLTMNPVFGEVSRAMRNRCVEICLCSTPAIGLLPGGTSLSGLVGCVPTIDLMKLAASMGVRDWRICMKMGYIHREILVVVESSSSKLIGKDYKDGREDMPHIVGSASVSVRNFVHWANLAAQGLRSGTDVRKEEGYVHRVVRMSLDQAYSQIPRIAREWAWKRNIDPTESPAIRAINGLANTSTPKTHLPPVFPGLSSRPTGFTDHETSVLDDFMWPKFLFLAIHSTVTELKSSTSKGITALGDPRSAFLPLHQLLQAFVFGKVEIKETNLDSKRVSGMRSLSVRALLTFVLKSSRADFEVRLRHLIALQSEIGKWAGPDLMIACDLLQKLHGFHGILTTKAAIELPELGMLHESLAADAIEFNSEWIPIIDQYNHLYRPKSDEKSKSAKRYKRKRAGKTEGVVHSSSNPTVLIPQLASNTAIWIYFYRRSAGIRLWAEAEWRLLDLRRFSTNPPELKDSPIFESWQIHERLRRSDQASHPFLAHAFALLKRILELVQQIAIDIVRGVTSIDVVRSCLDKSWQLVFARDALMHRLGIPLSMEAEEEVYLCCESLHRAASRTCDLFQETKEACKPIVQLCRQVYYLLERSSEAWGQQSILVGSPLEDKLWKSLLPFMPREKSKSELYQQLLGLEDLALSTKIDSELSALALVGSPWKRSLVEAMCSVQYLCERDGEGEIDEIMAFGKRALETLRRQLDNSIQGAKEDDKKMTIRIHTTSTDESGVGKAKEEDVEEVVLRTSDSYLAILAEHAAYGVSNVVFSRVEARLLSTIALLSAGDIWSVNPPLNALSSLLPDVESLLRTLETSTPRRPSHLLPFQILLFKSPNQAKDRRFLQPLLSSLWSHAAEARPPLSGPTMTLRACGLVRDLLQSPLCERERHKQEARVLTNFLSKCVVTSNSTESPSLDGWKGSIGCLLNVLGILLEDAEGKAMPIEFEAIGQIIQCAMGIDIPISQPPPEDIKGTSLGESKRFQALYSTVIYPALKLLYNAVQQGWLNPQFSSVRAARYTQGRLWAAAGLTQLHSFLSPRPLDPSLRYATCLRDAEYSKERCDVAITSEEVELDLMTNMTATKKTQASQYSRIGKRVGRLEDWNTLRNRCSKTAAETERLVLTRPNDGKRFRRLHMEIQNMLNSVLEPVRVHELLCALEPGARNINAQAQGTEDKLRKLDVCLSSMSHFSSRIRAQFSSDYPDIVTPVCAAIGWLDYGIREAMSSASDVKMLAAVEITLRALLVGCETSMVQSLQRLTDPRLLTALVAISKSARKKQVISASEEKKVPKKTTQRRHKQASGSLEIRVLYAALLQVEVLCGTSGGQLSPELSGLASALFSRLVSAWRRARESAMARERARNELYKFKEQTFEGNSADGEEGIERELVELYPEFHDTYMDITNGLTLDDMISEIEKPPGTEPIGNVKRDAQEETTEEEKDDEEYELDSKLLPYVYACYKRIFSGVSSPERVMEAWEQSYIIGCELVDAVEAMGMSEKLDMRLDTLSLPAHLLLVAHAHSRLTPRNKDTADTEFKLYKAGGNPEEIGRVEKPLKMYIGRLGVLLQEFEEHPMLLMLARLAERVGSLTSNSPVIEVLTGLELILKKSQEWQAYVPRRCSVEAQVKGLSELVMRWRRMELESWSDTLNRVDKEYYDKASTAWCHLFEITHVRTADLKAFVSAEEKETEESSSNAFLNELYKAATDFVQKCSFGELPARLDILDSLRSEINRTVCYSDPKPGDISPVTKMKMANVLGNVHKLHQELRVAAELRNERERKGVATKLKDAVKLARWDMSNYWSLRATTKSSHRKLCVLATQYRDILSPSVGAMRVQMEEKDELEYGIINVASIVAEIKEEIKIRAARKIQEHEEAAKEEKEGKGNNKKRRKRRNKRKGESESRNNAKASTSTSPSEPCTLKPSKPSPALRFPGGSVKPPITLHKGEMMGEMGTVSRRMARMVTSGIFGKEYNLHLDETVESISSVSHGIIRRSLALNLSTDKKAIHYKKKALVDLLKTLKSLGLSHRISDMKKCGSFAGDFKRSSRLSPLDERMVDSFGLDGSLCSGFAEGVRSSCQYSEKYYYRCANLVLKVRIRRSTCHGDISASEATRMLGYIEHLFAMITQQRSDISRLATWHSSLVRWLKASSRPAIKSNISRGPIASAVWRTKTFIDSVLYTLRKAVLILRKTESVPKATRTNGSESGECLASAGEMEGHISRVEEIQERVGKMVREMFPSVPTEYDGINRVGYGWIGKELEGVWKDLEGLAASQRWTETSSNLSDLSKIKHSIPTSKLHALSTIHAPNNPIQTPTFNPVLKELKLASQNIYKISKSRAATNPTSQSPTEDLSMLWNLPDDETTTTPAVLTTEQLLIQEHCHCRALQQALRADKILRLLIIHGTSPPAQIGTLVSQVTVMCEKVIERVLCVHTASSKLLYVLLNLSNALFSKGFCRPPEEMEGDGEGEDAPADGTGMGEGDTSGAKDVTNEIEDEEQLLGNKGDNDDTENQDTEERDQDPEEGLEMEKEFEGEMHDMPEEDDKEDEDEDADDEEEELDREMGELGDNKDVVDEKLWDESEDEEEDKEQQNEKTEKDAPVEGSNDVETAAKDGEDEKEDRKEEKREKEEQEITPPEPDGGEEEEKGGEEEDKINDGDEQFEENTGNDPMEFPEEMNLDGESEGEGESEAEAEGEGEDEEAGDWDETHKEEDIDENEDEETKEETKVDDVGSDHEEEGEGEGKEVEEEEAQKVEEEDAPGPEGEERKDKVMDVEEEEDGGDSKEEDLKENPIETDNGVAKNDDQKDSQATEEVQGDQGAGGAAPEEQQGDDDKAKRESENSASAAAPEAAEYGSGEANEQVGDPDAKDGQVQKGADEQQSAKERKVAQIQEPNPYRSLGDALKKWHERLDILDDTKDADQNQADSQGEEPDPADDSKAPASGKFEHVTEDQKADTQIAAAANEEEAAEFHPIDEEEKKEDQETESLEPPATEDIDESQMGLGTEQKDDEEQRRSDPRRRGGKERIGEMDLDAGEEEDMEVEEGEEEKVPTPDLEEKVESKEIPDVLVAAGESARAETKDQDLDDDAIKALRTEIETALREAPKTANDPVYSRQWEQLSLLTGALSRRLCEQLRAILEPLSATRLKGDYRTGKRINIKKIIPYIASQFRKDKIWMRRTKPNKRDYQVMIAIDDSQSMRENNAGTLALEALATLTQALTLLEVGEISVLSFGEKVNVVHPFGRPFSDQTGAFALSKFTFEQKSTEWSGMVKSLIDVLERSQLQRSSRLSSTSSQILQLVFIISDARIQQDRETVARWCREALHRRQLLVMLVVDSPDPKHSILKLRSVTYPSGKLKITQYLEEFPFPFYIVLRDLSQLPEVVADTLRQWFELIQHLSC